RFGWVCCITVRSEGQRIARCDFKALVCATMAGQYRNARNAGQYDSGERLCLAICDVAHSDLPDTTMKTNPINPYTLVIYPIRDELGKLCAQGRARCDAHLFAQRFGPLDRFLFHAMRC